MGPTVQGYLGWNSKPQYPTKMRTLAQSVVEIEERGTASGPCEVQLRMVNR